MPFMRPAQGLLEPVHDAFGLKLPPNFAGALEHAHRNCTLRPCRHPQLYAALAPNAPGFVVTL